MILTLKIALAIAISGWQKYKEETIMKTRKTAKFVVLSSVICLILCCSLAIGSTFAWFTDSVASGTNIIKSGILDIEMFYKEPGATDWTDASQGAIFNYQLWEPGYVDVKEVKIANVGTLALQYYLLLTAEGNMDDLKLAEVIDVYIGENAPATRADLSNLTRVGTLREVMGSANSEKAGYGILLPAEGKGSDNVTLKAEDAAIAVRGETTYTIALKMQEGAGNEYQNLSIGLNGVKVMLDATQYTWENDAFDHLYDDMNTPAGGGENDSPKATIIELDVPEQDMLVAVDLLGGGSFTSSLNTLKVKPQEAFTFVAPDNAKSVENSPYKEWRVDYFVSIADGKSYSTATPNYDGLILVGAYGNWENGGWFGFKVPNNTNGLVVDGMDVNYSNPIGLLGVVGQAWTYEDIVTGVGTFHCGFVNYSDANVGDKMTVELRLTNPENSDDYISVASITKTLEKATAPVVDNTNP